MFTCGQIGHNKRNKNCPNYYREIDDTSDVIDEKSDVIDEQILGDNKNTENKSDVLDDKKRKREKCSLHFKIILFEKQGGKCAGHEKYCPYKGEKLGLNKTGELEPGILLHQFQSLECDHIDEFHESGNNDYKNCQLLCKDCHSFKNATLQFTKKI